MLRTNWIKSVIRFNCVLLTFFFLVCTMCIYSHWPVSSMLLNGNWKRLSISFGWSDASCYHIACIQFIQTNRHSTNKVTLFSRFKCNYFNVCSDCRVPCALRSLYWEIETGIFFFFFCFVIQPARKPNLIFEFNCLPKIEKERDRERKKKEEFGCLFTLALPEEWLHSFNLCIIKFRHRNIIRLNVLIKKIYETKTKNPFFVYLTVKLEVYNERVIKKQIINAE